MANAPGTRDLRDNRRWSTRDVSGLLLPADRLGLPRRSTSPRKPTNWRRKLGEAKSDSDRSKIKEDLSQILEKQFDLRQKRHLDEIKSLEAKVKKLKELVDKRQENRREIVSKRLDQILSDAEGLGW